MSDVSLRLLLTGVDKSASRSLKGVGDEAGKTGGKMSKLGAVGKVAGAAMLGGLVLAGAAAVKFGGDSLAAYADAEKSQAKLTDAYKRFPAVADVNIEALRKYNQAVQRKTGADADDIAAGQANLAMFGLTGKQIKATTPLLVDYANKTGKDLPTSAKVMGKALLGNTKALKDMGIVYKPTGDKAKDYANIMGLLRDKVGGYTASIPEAETKSKILAASFGDLQEAAGAKLQPVMIQLVDAGQAVIDWLDANPAVAEGAAAAFDLVGQALGGIWEMIKAFVLPALAMFIDANVAVVRGVQSMLEALGNVPGFEWAKGAAAKVGKVADSMSSVADGVRALSKVPDPQIAINDKATAQVKKIDAKIKSLKGKIVKAEAKGDGRQVDALKKKIAALRGKKIDINAHVRKTGVTSISLSGGGGGRMLVSAKARGGAIRAGRPYLVGEEGPELITPSRSGWVHTASKTAALGRGGMGSMAGGMGGGSVVNNYFTAELHTAVVDPSGARAVVTALNRLSLSQGRKGFKP